MRFLAALAMAMAPAVAGAQDLVFDERRIASCLNRPGGAAIWQSCPGLEANRCMDATPGGSSTAGMVGCLDAELTWWDGALNRTYRRVMAEAKAQDLDRFSGAPSMATALRAMQRAWIPYRDAKCDFARSQWGGGTGAGPAGVACLLHETAEQTIYLKTWAMGG